MKNKSLGNDKKIRYYIVADTYETGKGEMAYEGDNIVYCGNCHKRYFSSFGSKKEKWERKKDGSRGRRFWECEECKNWNTVITLNLADSNDLYIFESLPKETEFSFKNKK